MKSGANDVIEIIVKRFCLQMIHVVAQNVRSVLSSHTFKNFGANKAVVITLVIRGDLRNKYYSYSISFYKVIGRFGNRRFVGVLFFFIKPLPYSKANDRGIFFDL